MSTSGPDVLAAEGNQSETDLLLDELDTTRIATRMRPWFLRAPAGQYLAVSDVLAFALSVLISGNVGAVQLILLAVMMSSLKMYGLYKSRLTLSALDDLPYIVRSAAGFGLCAVFTLNVYSGPLERLTLWGTALQMVALTALVSLGRVASYWAIRDARRRGLVRHPAVIVGAGHVGIHLANTLRERRELGVDPVGFIDDRPRVDDLRQLPAPVLGRYEQLNEVLNDFGVRLVIVAFGSLSESDLIDILRTCDRLQSEIFVVPRLFEVHSTTRDLDEIRGMPLVRVRRAPFRRRSWKAKRLFDIVFSSLALAALSPVLAGCAIAVWRDGGRGILFRQTRVGIDGRPFDILKFRSMRPASVSESSTKWNISQDHRLSRTGRFLRKTSLDELPQLWNILKGDMSIVGPRPERPYFVNEFAEHIPRYTARHRVPAGLTGWAQVNGLRGDTSIEDRARFDNYYVENWSLWTDTRIVLRTVGQVLRQRGG